jgi:hypothetical protein
MAKLLSSVSILKNASPVWKAFRLDRNLDYQESNKAFCMKCIQKTADGKTKIHFEKWILCCQEWLAEHDLLWMHVQMMFYGQRRMHSFTG